MINLPTQLIWDELTRKIGYPTHYWRENVKNVFLKAKANYTKFQQPTLIDAGLNLSDYKFGQEHQQLKDVGLNLSDYKFGQEHKRKYEKRLLF